MSTDRIGVAFIITVLDRMGGAEKNLYDVVTNLDRNRFTPVVITFKGGVVTDRLVKKGIDVHILPVGKLLSLGAVRQAAVLYRFLRGRQTQVVVTYHHDADILGGLVAWVARVPKILSSRRDMGYQLESKHIWFYRLGHYVFDRFITVSEAVKKVIIERERIPENKVGVIHNGLLPEEYLPDATKKERYRRTFAMEPNHLLIGCVASFRPIKGQMFLVDAVAAMLQRFPALRVLFVGYHDTDYGKRVQEHIETLGLQSHCHFAGKRDDVPSLLNGLDIFVVPSLNEGFSNAIIEAMATALPVIAARSGGNPEAVIDGETGLLFEPENSRDLAEKLVHLCENPLLRKKLGHQGAARVEQCFQLQVMVAKYADELQL